MNKTIDTHCVHKVHISNNQLQAIYHVNLVLRMLSVKEDIYLFILRKGIGE